MLHTLFPSYDWYDTLIHEPVLRERAPHFMWNELKCHGFENSYDCCWGKVAIDESILLKAEEVRFALGGKPLTVLSGYRCVTWNREIGGKILSRHNQGLALDLKFDVYEVDAVYDIVTKLLPFSGLGIYNWGIHIDMDTAHGKRRWDERKDI